MDACFVRLAENPALAAERCDFDPPGRIHRHERHLIVYLAEDDGILVLRVLHETMDVPAHLSGNDPAVT